MKISLCHISQFEKRGFEMTLPRGMSRWTVMKIRFVAALATAALLGCATLPETASPAARPVSVIVIPENVLPGAGPLLESYFAAAGAGLVPASELTAFSPAQRASGAKLCAHTGLSACVYPQIERTGDRVRISLRMKADSEVVSENIEAPLRETSQALYSAFVSLMDKALAGRQIPASMWNSDAQLRAARVVRPQYDSLAAFARGLEAEAGRPEEATLYYRQALAIDPDFVLPYARLFYTVYYAQLLPHAAETDIATQNRFRLDAGSVFWLALAFRDLGSRALKNGAMPAAEAYFRRSLALLTLDQKEASLPGALALFGLGDAALKGRNSMAALYNFHAAEQALESGGAERSFLHLAGKIRLGAAYLLDDKPGLAAHSYERAGRTAAELGLTDSPVHAMILANTGLLAMRQRNPAEALKSYDLALSRLRSHHMSQTTLYLAIAAHRGNALRLLGEIAQAEETFNQVISESKVLGLEQSVISAEAMYSNGVLSMVRGDILRAQYLMISAQTTMARLGNNRAAPDYLPMEMLSGGDGHYSSDEVRLLSSYCGAFSYTSHARWIQARTYEGRLDDTNVLLKDLLDSRKTDSAALNQLRSKFLPAPDPSGRGVVFIDIGPAIANLTNPGVTAVSLARDFPAMQVIALDLPEQVEIFNTTVSPYLRSRVLLFPNLHVFAGNGIHPLAAQFENASSWVKRQKIDPRGQPIVIRAANSIDIYESWETNKNALDRIAADFADSPIIYLFNRSILFKPAGARRFFITGILSMAGFDHMFETFNRRGENAYLLSLSALR